MSKNAQRRHHLNRLKHKRHRDLVVAHLTDDSVFRPNSSKQKHLARHVTTPKPCSCWLCGNPRKFYGNGKAAKTYQENRQENKQTQTAINEGIFQANANEFVA